MRREEVTALLMVAPALVIVFLVALYPLGSGFFNSFTDSTFASDQPARFVGLRNYASLLGLRLRVLHPVGVAADGKVRYESPSEVFKRVELFRLTDASLRSLRGAGVPTALVERLGAIRNRPVSGRTEFSVVVQAALGAESTRYLSLVLESADRSSYRYGEIAQFSLVGVRFVVGARDPDFVAAMANTLAFTVVTVTFETILGTLLALLINRKSRARGAMRALLLLPWAVPTAISSRMWEWMFASTRIGLFNVVFQKLGWGDGQIPFLQLPGWQLPAMCIIDVWKTTPFMALLILAGLQLIPAELYEASEADGVGKLRQFWSMTLPLLKPTIAVALVFRTLDALRVFDLFQIVLGQSRYSMASFTYYQLIQSRAAGYSSASGVLIFVIIFVFAVLYTRALGVNAESDLG